MKKLLLLITTALLCHHSIGQGAAAEIKRLGARKVPSLDSNGWKHTGVFTLNVNQAALGYWSSGGETFLIGINGVFNKSIHHRYGKYTFDSYIDLELGVVEAASFKKFRKTNDRCDITMEFEHSLTKKHLNYGVLFNLNTQVFGGHNYYVEGHPLISAFMSPGKALVCLGLDYKYSNASQYFSAFFAPLTLRWITKINHHFYDRKMFGVDSARKIYKEVGAYLSLHYNRNFTKTIKYIGRLDLISNYRRKPGNVDLLFNNLFTFAIAKNFAGSLLVDLIYDDDIRRRLQVQEITGIGLKFNL